MGARAFRLGVPLAACLLTLAQPCPAQVLRTLLDQTEPDAFAGYAVDASGATVVAVWKGGFFGSNPQHIPQVYEWAMPAGVATRLTSFPEGVNGGISITDDGQWIVFDSAADPILQNGDGSVELFRMRADGTELTQLTDDDALGGGNAYCPEISGAGNRILFQGTYNPSGQNPDHLDQLFVLDTVSSAVTSLTTGDSGMYRQDCGARDCGFSISDDGERIVFTSSADLTGGNPDGSLDVFKIDADGQNLAQLTNDGGEVGQISGHGVSVVYSVEFSGPPWSEVRAVGWDGTGAITLAEGSAPTIEDSGTTVYYNSNSSQIRSVPITGGAYTPLRGGHDALISGSNTRIVYVTDFLPWGHNPDGGPEMATMNHDGPDPKQLTISAGAGFVDQPNISADGTSIAYGHDGGSAPHGLFHRGLDDPAPTRLTSDVWVYSPSLTGNGETVVFMSTDDLLGVGDCNTDTIYRVQSNGAGLAQVTGCERNDMSSEVDPSASLVVTQGSNDGFGWYVYTTPLAGGAPAQISNEESGAFANPSISADGLWAAWQTYGTGCPASPCIQTLRGRTDGSFVEQVSSNTVDGLIYGFPDITGDGRFVVYTARHDPFGTNPDQNREVFLYDAQTAVTTQLTVTTGNTAFARISHDGAWVYLTSDSPLIAPQDAGRPSLYRLRLATGQFERVGGSRSVKLDTPWGEFGGPFGVDGNGGRVVFKSYPDRFGCREELLLADFDTQATIRPGKEAPTVVEWDADPRAVHYDVIRGDVGDLAPGAGDTVDLGTVTCLENDTYNTSTAGADADTDQPAPGQVFFFVHRFSPGGNAAAGSYGVSASGAARVPSAGDCPQ